MADIKVPQSSTARVIDVSGASGHEPLDNGAKARARFVRVFELEEAHLAGARRLSDPSCCRPTQITVSSSKTFRRRVGIEPFTKYARVVIMYTSNDLYLSNQGSIQITSDTDGIGVTQYIYGESADTAAGALSFEAVIQVGGGGSIDFSTLSNGYETITAVVTTPALSAAPWIRILSFVAHPIAQEVITV